MPASVTPMCSGHVRQLAGELAVRGHRGACTSWAFARDHQVAEAAALAVAARSRRPSAASFCGEREVGRARPARRRASRRSPRCGWGYRPPAAASMHGVRLGEAPDVAGVDAQLRRAAARRLDRDVGRRSGCRPPRAAARRRTRPRTRRGRPRRGMAMRTTSQPAAASALDLREVRRHVAGRARSASTAPTTGRAAAERHAAHHDPPGPLVRLRCAGHPPLRFLKRLKPHVRAIRTCRKRPARGPFTKSAAKTDRKRPAEAAGKTDRCPEGIQGAPYRSGPCAGRSKREPRPRPRCTVITDFLPIRGRNRLRERASSGTSDVFPAREVMMKAA